MNDTGIATIAGYGQCKRAAAGEANGRTACWIGRVERETRWSGDESRRRRFTRRSGRAGIGTDGYGSEQASGKKVDKNLFHSIEF